ncbi:MULTISPECIES: LysR family transcriptional regulator [Pedobacter]|jgi:DNA-binding transcriptional LysR family regulator|uniref:LysR family transcriptional regulator n=1 Tax=Pedobacter TaxID=84567 RepID=UPI000D3D5033|nr:MULTISPECIES: LysR family transcriptional regulator [Pedobacter]PTS97119.1 transcriptional regulator [Pedobacter sp. HMWF019]HWW42812.1 LysR family transcriptional regulator [Pedobacter sp.]
MGYQIELRHLKYFQVLAQELKFRVAAEKLFISQPGLTRQIQQMEEIFNVTLFDRTKRKVELTAAGLYLKGEVDFMFNHLETVKRQLENIGQGKEAELRIGFLGSAAQKVLPELLLKLNASYPGIQTTLEEMSNKLQVELLEKDKLDLGFVRLPRVPDGMSKHLVFTDSFSVVLPKNYPLDKESFKNVRQLSNEPFIFFSSDDSPFYYELIMSICEDQGFRPKVFHKSVHALTIFKLVEEGLGVAIVPSSLKYGYDLEVKFIEIENIGQRTELFAIWKDTNRNPALKNAVDLLV